jgi:hypothetical protein
MVRRYIRDGNLFRENRAYRNGETLWNSYNAASRDSGKVFDIPLTRS